MSIRFPQLLLLFLISVFSTSSAHASHDDLLALFHEWRQFEQPPDLDGAPDYREQTNRARLQGLRVLQARLNEMDISGWSIEEQVDWHLVRAEMNGMEFNIRVLRPWQRDPAYYTSVWTFESDTPAHEGPNHHALVELWTYSFPLDQSAQQKLAHELSGIPPLLAQARTNLTGNARELWIGGIKNIDDQAGALEALREQVLGTSKELENSVDEALEATRSFSDWLNEQSASKTGPSGIGADLYTWHLRNVHYVPLSWEDERFLLKRELDRSHSSLALEEHRNRDLPAQVAIASEAEYEVQAEKSLQKMVKFLVDGEILPDYPYIEPALRAHMGQFVPEEQRIFFYTVMHFDPLALWTHWYHWFDLARIKTDPHPSPVRAGALLYNIFDSRSEGMATGFEEMMMNAGLFDDTPRSRELVYIMLAQRAARGLGSLLVHSGEYTLKQARDFHVKWTPRGWMREDLDLLGFEQLLYLRQPGYGTSYVTGKYLIERLLGEVTKLRGDDFSLRSFFADLDDVGVIPVSLIRWQMTGQGDELEQLMSPEWTAWPEGAPQ